MNQVKNKKKIKLKLKQKHDIDMSKEKFEPAWNAASQNYILRVRLESSTFWREL